MFTFKHVLLLNFHCLTYSALVIADDHHTKRNVVSQLSWRKDHRDKIHSVIVELQYDMITKKTHLCRGRFKDANDRVDPVAGSRSCLIVSQAHPFHHLWHA